MIKTVSYTLNTIKGIETRGVIESEKTKMLSNHLQRHYQLFKSAKSNSVFIEVKKEYEMRMIYEFFKKMRRLLDEKERELISQYQSKIKEEKSLNYDREHLFDKCQSIAASVQEELRAMKSQGFDL